MKGIIIKKQQVDNYCANYDPFGMCLIDECFKCPNCDYRLELEDGTILRDFKFKGLKKSGIEVEKFNIEIFDDITGKDIDEYLSNPKSDYQLTDKSGGIWRYDIIGKGKNEEQQRDIQRMIEETRKQLFGYEYGFKEDVRSQKHNPQIYILCNYAYIETSDATTSYIMRLDRQPITEQDNPIEIYRSYLKQRLFVQQMDDEDICNCVNFEITKNKKKIKVTSRVLKKDKGVKGFVKTLKNKFNRI